MYVCMYVWAGIAQLLQRLATGWTSRGPNPGVGEIFPHPSRPALGRIQQPIHRYRLFPGCKAAGAWASTPTHYSSAEVKEIVELYIFSPPWAFADCSEVNFSFTYVCMYVCIYERMYVLSQPIPALNSFLFP